MKRIILYHSNILQIVHIINNIQIRDVQFAAGGMNRSMYSLRLHRIQCTKKVFSYANGQDSRKQQLRLAVDVGDESSCYSQGIAKARWVVADRNALLCDVTS